MKEKSVYIVHCTVFLSVESIKFLLYYVLKIGQVINFLNFFYGVLLYSRTHEHTQIVIKIYGTLDAHNIFIKTYKYILLI